MPVSYEVEYLAGHRPKKARSRSHVKDYLIKWKNYSKSENTWENAKRMASQVPLMVELYWKGKETEGIPSKESQPTNKVKKRSIETPSTKAAPENPGPSKKRRKMLTSSPRSKNSVRKSSIESIDKNVGKLEVDTSKEEIKPSKTEPDDHHDHDNKIDEKENIRPRNEAQKREGQSSQKPDDDNEDKEHDHDSHDPESSCHDLDCRRCHDRHSTEKLKLVVDGKKHKIKDTKVKGLFLRKNKPGLIISGPNLPNYLFVPLDDNEIMEALKPKIKKFLRRKGIQSLDQLEPVVIDNENKAEKALKQK